MPRDLTDTLRKFQEADDARWRLASNVSPDKTTGVKSSRLALLSCAVVVSFGCLRFTPSTCAALPAFDSAADTAYDTGWTAGSNGGFGFTPWRIDSNADATHFAGTFIGDAGASSVNPAINTNGRAFGMYANVPPDTTGASVSAQRDFTGGVLMPGQSFSLQIALNYRDGAKGVYLNGVSPFGNGVLGGFFTGGFPHHHSLFLYGATPEQGVDYTFHDYHPDSLFTITFTMVELTVLQANLTRTTANGIEHVVTLTANVSAPTASGFNLYYGSTAQSAPQLDLYSNNFAVVPEPGTVGLLIVGSLAAGLRFIRRRR